MSRGRGVGVEADVGRWEGVGLGRGGEDDGAKGKEGHYACCLCEEKRGCEESVVSYEKGKKILGFSLSIDRMNQEKAILARAIFGLKCVSLSGFHSSDE